MATGQTNKVLQQIRRVLHLGAGAELTDGQLLDCFIQQRDESAFAALVRRHGPMVWGVCRRALPNSHDAEDAFQASFLVLVRKAASVRPREMVASWLYGVANNTAAKARAMIQKRRGREKQVAELPEAEAARQEPLDDLPAILDQELGGLPERYRIAILLCDLEGKTRKEAAHQLGVPEGTLSARLTRARRLLAGRLTRRGLNVSGGIMATALGQAASAEVPAAVLWNTVKAANGLAAGQAASVVSAKVAALTEGVLKTMLLQKLKIVSVVLVIMALLGAGTRLLTYRTQAEEQPGPAVAPVQPGEKKGNAQKSTKDEEAIQGTWIAVKLDQVNHEPSKEEQDFLKSGKFRVVITADKITYPDKSEARYTLIPTKTPKQIELKGMVNGKELTVIGIYSLQGDELKICTGRVGDGPPPGFDVEKAKKGKPETFGMYCWTYKRAKEPAQPKQKEEARLNEVKKLEGSWIVVSDAGALSPVMPLEKQKGAKWIIENGLITFAHELKQNEKDRIYRFFQVDPIKNPKTITLYYFPTPEGNGIPILIEEGIYELNGDQLKIHFAAPLKPRPVAFPAKPEPGQVTILQREKQPLQGRWFGDGVMELKDHNFDLRVGKAQFWGTFTTDPGKSPKEIDVIITKTANQAFDPRGGNWKGIYSLEGNTLKLCFGKDRPTEFQNKESNKQEVFQFKKVLESDPKDPPPPKPEEPKKSEQPKPEEPKKPLQAGDAKTKLWAAISVTRPIFLAIEDTAVGIFQIQFTIVNDGDKTIDPEINSSKLLVNGKELKDWGFIVGNGPKTKQFTALPPGENIQFGYSLGRYFEEPGIYRVSWQGKAFQSNEIIFRVVTKKSN